MPQNASFEPTKEEQEAALIGGWLLVIIGLLIVGMDTASLILHYREEKKKKKRASVNGFDEGDAEAGTAAAGAGGSSGSLSPKKLGMSQAIKWTLLAGVSFRIIDVLYGMYFAVPMLNSCAEGAESCQSYRFVFWLLFNIPPFTVNTLFILVSLFWVWLVLLVKKSGYRMFPQLFPLWAILSAIMWLSFVLIFMAFAAFPSKPWIINILLVLDWCFTVIFALVFLICGSLMWFGILRQYGQPGKKFTNKLLTITAFQLIFSIIRGAAEVTSLATTITPSIFWITLILSFDFVGEFLPAFLLILLFTPRWWCRIKKSKNQVQLPKLTSPLNSSTF